MFSGIVEGTGQVKSIEPQAGGVRLIIDLGDFAKDLKIGDSVAINGVCLTVAGIQNSEIAFDVITETLRKTNLGMLKVDSKTNVERSMRLQDRLEGHLVQGHIQGVAEVIDKVTTDKDFKLTLKPLGELMVYVAPLGSIAVNGVSLTIAEALKDSFSVALIPTTLERTNLGQLQIGDAVNIETDLVARQIVHWLKQRAV